MASLYGGIMHIEAWIVIASALALLFTRVFRHQLETAPRESILKWGTNAFIIASIMLAVDVILRS